MAAAQPSNKRVAITKANAQMVIIVAVASVVSVFSLVATKAVIGQNQYQARLTKAKETANKDLNKDIKAFNQLNSSYATFDNQPINIISGSRTGPADNDGDNAKIILDALPKKYDFPALATSLQKLLTDRGFQITGLTGTDDQIAQQTNLLSPTPQPVPMPFTFAVDNANYIKMGDLLKNLEQSIRPIQIDTLNVIGGGDNLTVSTTAHTYYQPARSFAITTKVQK